MSKDLPSPLGVVYSPSRNTEHVLPNALPKKSLSVMDENSFNLLIKRFQEAASDLLAS